jgi:hypothetical protein
MKEREKLELALKSLFEASKTAEDFNALSERLKRKVKRGIAYPGLTESEFYGAKKKILRESILDPIQKTRPTYLFGSDEKMLPEARNWIVDKIKSWSSNEGKSMQIGEVLMYGSSTGFQYVDGSDVDLQTTVKASPEDVEKFGRLVSLGFLNDNGKNPVTLFLIPEAKRDEIYRPERFENIYSIDKDDWVKKTEKNSYEIPYSYIMELSEFFMNGFDLAMSDYERNKQQFINYSELNPAEQEITEKEKRESMSKAMTDLKSSHDRLRMSLSILKSFLDEGYEGNPFTIHISYNDKKDPRLSVNNAVYKMLEKFGYNQRIWKAIDDGEKFISEAEGRMKSNG